MIASKPERSSNLELFRCIMMWLIIAHHFVVNSGIGDSMWNHPSAVNNIFLFVFGAWGKMAINCFVLITGYFMCTSEISISKFGRLFVQVLFYNIVFYFIFLFCGYEEVSVTRILHLFPINDVQSNFVSCFLLFYLCIPFLNILIRNVTKRQHLLLIAISLFIYTVLNLLFSITMNYVSWFVVLYFISSYLRLYPVKILESTRNTGLISVLFIVLSIMSILVCVYISVKLNIRVHYYLLSDSNAIFALLTAIALFMFFKNIKIKHSKFINGVATTTFGILMIHANSDAMRQWLWQDFVRVPQMVENHFFALYAILSVCGIFLVCATIDYICSKLIFSRVNKIIETHIK